jgi:flagellar assembly factor FliW
MISVAHDDTSVHVDNVRTISSLVLGDVVVTDDVVMTFETPLWGFGDHREFALLPAARDGLWWLQSMHSDTITFLLADPFVLDAHYALDLGDTERQSLGIEQPSDAFSLVMVTLPATDADGATGNFRAPLVFNVGLRRGMQVVSRDEGHELRRPVTLDVFPAQESGLRMV